jgi:hypothetical protein
MLNLPGGHAEHHHVQRPARDSVWHNFEQFSNAEQTRFSATHKTAATQITAANALLSSAQDCKTFVQLNLAHPTARGTAESVVADAMVAASKSAKVQLPQCGLSALYSKGNVSGIPPVISKFISLPFFS